MVLKSSPGMRRDELCCKRPVVAVLVTPAGEVFIGDNSVTKPQEVCPRIQQGYKKGGKGWHLCREICGQSAHAEIDALNQAGDAARGGRLNLVGHWTACDDCMAALAEASVDIDIVTERYSEEALTDLLAKIT